MPAAYDPAIAAIALRDERSRAVWEQVMRTLDQTLAKDDGLRWFNLLYLRVTESVKEQPPGAGWEDAAWLQRLDVVFAGLYFDALVAWAKGPKSASKCWGTLLESRWRKDVARIQFALAGMNAHINHDLAFALLRTSVERGAMPERGSAQHRDFERVNTLLERVEAEVKALLLSAQVQEVDRHFGRVDDVIALWKVRKARDTGWENGEILWQMRQLPLVSDKYARNLDRLVGLSSKGLLVPTEIA